MGEGSFLVSCGQSTTIPEHVQLVLPVQELDLEDKGRIRGHQRRRAEIVIGKPGRHRELRDLGSSEKLIPAVLRASED